MADIRLQNQLNTMTNVPNRFIDEYMVEADGEFVKIYLYLLRCMNTPDCDFSISMIADQLEHTERDVIRALKYWESRNLLRLEYDETHTLSGICLMDQSTMGMPCAYAPAAPQTPQQPAKKADFSESKEHFTVTSAAAPQTPDHDFTSDETAQLQENEEIKELIFITGQYLGRSLTQTELTTLLFWYDRLGFPVELITYLLEYCIGKGHTSFRYMDKVALAWAEKNIHTVEQAKQESANYSKDVYTVMRAFGIQNRNLIEPELAYIKKWTKQYGFTSDIITEACRRTLQSTQKPSFEYADKILTDWYHKDVHHMADIVTIDTAFQKARKSSAAPSKAPTAAPNKFNNFPQRSCDYNELARQLMEN
ncbi:MAG: DnaD domain protein [Lachnospiraceae bacterium]